MIRNFLQIGLVCLLILVTSLAQAQSQSFPNDWAEKITWRSIGPANMSGRITSIAVYEEDPCIWWAASASGGLLKTINNGVLFKHQFDSESTVSIGDVQVAQSDPNIVWVGTGEANPRNSVSWGDGVYKSTDGGETWKNMGLKKTYQIGRIAIHPENPDVVYVGALGRLWGPNEDRGLFKTTDGGKSWEKVLFVDDKTGVIDVQMHPKDPDTLMIATYERMRDGFDGNDPVKKYGDGSAIYRTTDGGKSFEKLSKGLPSCKLGRIGIDFYHKNPKYVYAIVESEKIASQPEDTAYAGITAEDAEVGARVTRVTNNGPGEEAGLQEGDVIVQVDGKLIHTYNELLKEIRMHKAGDDLKIIGSREKETIELELKLTKRPSGRNGRARGGRNPFTGTLGGQAANLQGQQGGKEENQFGGIYMSKDGGDSWKRINTLNPRPMYYSQFRVDPTDRNHMFVLGTSLYRSSDGGETFTGDGGRGIHPDNHAMWIDPNDGRHMILGNDGGVYVTYDRMDNWTHHNQFAIGQFYHVGVDNRGNYNVYGGLQDNGSWGGPSRSRSGGIINTDWFRIGGGDGFICLVDPDDPNQLYMESQNGAMQRRNLKTGERGFVRPQAQRGVRYRFNWKTPFILSPHNSKIHYSAGNYVFKSNRKGDGTQAISPEITNTDRGSGSAISESAVQEGVIYAGTTDGAIWMTRDGGKEWTAIYSVKEEKDDSDSDDDSEEQTPDESASSDAEEQDDKSTEAAEEKSSDQDKSDKDASDKGDSDKGDSDKDAAGKDDQISGTWTVQLISDRVPRGGTSNSFELEMDDEGKISGSFNSRRGEQEISSGTFDKETGKILISIANERGETTFEGELTDGKIVGQLDFAGRFQIEFEATRDKQDPVSAAAGYVSVSSELQDDDSVTNLSGYWTGKLISDQIPEAMSEFEMQLTFNANGTVVGSSSTPQGDAELAEGQYLAERKTFSCYMQNVNFGAVVTAKMVSDKKLAGKISVNDGQVEVDFEATFDRPFANAADAANEADASQESDASQADESSSQTEQSGTAQSSEQEAAENEASASDVAMKDDPVGGKWSGEFDSEFFTGDQANFTMEFKTDGKGKITGGSIESERLNGEVTEGEYDAKKGSISFFVETTRSSIEFDGELKDGSMEGDADIGGGRFTFGFSAKLDSATEEAVAANDSSDSKAEIKSSGSFAELVPGPRWVSSIEASRYKGGRVYLTLDGHRSNDDEPYVFASENFGKTWKSIRANLPTSAGSTRVIREDARNEDVLYLGCEFSAWVSIDRGESWTKLSGLPTVAVHEIAVHPTAGEIVAATHGRSLWIADVSLLQQIDKDAKNAKAALYRPKTFVKRSRGDERGSIDRNQFSGQNPYNGTRIMYSIGERANSATVVITDIRGEEIREFEAETGLGLHVIEWNLSRAQRGRATGQFRNFGGGRQIASGTYLITLTVDGEEFKQPLEVVDDEDFPVNAVAEELEELEEFWRELLGEDD